VFLPNDLAPLPVAPRGDETAAGGTVPFEDFVRAGDIRKVLLGWAGELPVEGLSSDDFDSFAGRSDVSCPSASRWTAPVEARLAVPDLALEPQVIHPAFELLPPTRRATPPRSRGVEDCEATFGRSKPTDRWWVLGMGLAAAAILFSGATVDFISREAVRRSGSEVEPVTWVIPTASETAEPAKDERPEAIAATLRPEKKP
jgi:hypothetical protein